MTEAAHQIASNPLPPGAAGRAPSGRAAGPEIAILDCRRAKCSRPGRSARSRFAARASSPATTTTPRRTPRPSRADGSGPATRGARRGRLPDASGRIKEIINRGGEKIVARRGRRRASRATRPWHRRSRSGCPTHASAKRSPQRSCSRPDTDADERALQDFVAQTLAPFKVPRRIVLVDEIPKGPTGKVQRIGLAERLGVSSRTDGRPTTSSASHHFEASLAAVWADVLGIPSMSVHDDFFALGGDSILGAEAVARIRELTRRRGPSAGLDRPRADGCRHGARAGRRHLGARTLRGDRASSERVGRAVLLRSRWRRRGAQLRCARASRR